ncbi:MAG: CHASE domain-containing protein [Oligoflexales bacterium]
MGRARWRFVNLLTAVRRSKISQIILVALVYLVSGRMALLLAIPPGYASASFPPAGIALSSLLLLGPHVWPGVWLGSFAMNSWVSLSAVQPAPSAPEAFAVSCIIGLGAALQALCGEYLIRRFVEVANPFTTVNHVVKFFLIAVLSCIISPSIGVSTLWVSDFLVGTSFFISWWTWWAGDALGVIVVTPLVLIWFGRRKGLWIDRRTAVTVPLLLAFGVISFFSFTTRRAQQERLHQEFEGRTSDLVSAIMLSFDGYLNTLHSLQSVFNTFPQLTQDEFHTLAHSLLASRPSILALAWFPVVSESDRSAFEADASLSLKVPFRITELGDGGELVPAANRPRYVVARYIEPLKGNEHAFGFDILSERERAAAVDKARKTGTPAATSRVNLVIQKEGLGYIVFEPVYENSGDVPDPTDRPVSGFVGVVLRVEDVVQNALRHTKTVEIDFELRDDNAPLSQQSLFTIGTPEYDARLDKVPDHLGAEVRKIEIAGQTLTLKTFPPEEYFERRDWESWALQAVGLFFTACLGAFFLVVTGQRQLVQQNFAQKTEELRRKNRFVKLLQIVAAAANRNSKDLLKLCVDEICSITNWPIGHAYLLTGGQLDKKELVSSEIWHLDDPIKYAFFQKISSERLDVEGDALPQRVLASKRPVWITDILGDDSAPRAEVAGDIGIRAGFGLPILGDGEVFGVLEFFAATVLEPDVDLIQVMTHVGTQLGEAFKREKAESALTASERRNRMIIDTAYDAFVAINQEGMIVEWNFQAEALFGWSRASVIGKPIVETIIPVHLREAHLKGMQRFLEAGYGPFLNRRVEITALHQNGNEFPVELTISAIREGKRHNFNAFIHDISERKHLEANRREYELALRAANEELESKVKERTASLEKANVDLSTSNAELEQFAGVAAHDLRAPIKSMESWIDVLDMHLPSQREIEVDEAIRFVRKNSKKAVHLIGDLLEVARANVAGNIPEEVDLNETVRLVIDLLHEEISASDAILQVESLPIVFGNPTYLEGVFSNLIRNALTYRHADRIPTIAISCKTMPDYFEFSVEDNGIGIAKEYRDRIFEMFRRVHSDSAYPGTGIGLAYCKKVIGLSGGKIWVTSTLGKGSTFHFTYPRNSGGNVIEAPHLDS